MSKFPYDPKSDAEDVREYVIKFLENLQRLSDLSNLSHLTAILRHLNHVYFSHEQFRSVMSEELKSKKFVLILSDILKELSKVGYFKDNDVWYPTYFCYSLLWNFSDNDQELANQIVATSLPDILIANVLHEPYVSNLQSTNIYYLMKSTVSIIHNVCRVPTSDSTFKRIDLKNGLVRLIKINDSDFLGLVSMLTLACLVNEDELSMLEEGKSSIRLLISKIKTARENVTHRTDGFAVWELVNGLKMVSVNDNMKKSIVKEDGLYLIMDIVNNPSCDEDVDKAMGTLWNLCFDKEIRNSLVTDCDVKAVIMPHRNHKWPSVKKSYEGIMWLIDSKSQSIERAKSAVQNRQTAGLLKANLFNAFLSYSWANKPMVLSIKDELIKAGLKVWIDVDQMKGSTLEAMADGIESSNVFLMAVSESYRTSPNCRTEAEYAFSLKKPIIPLLVEAKYKASGWLGLIMGSKLYFEFTERRNFQESFQSLLHELTNPDDDNNNLQQSETKKAVNTTPILLPIASETVKNWSKTDVSKWLASSQLAHLKLKFSDINGLLLFSLMDINQRSPDYLFQTLKLEYGMKLIDVLKLNMALIKLSQQ